MFILCVFVKKILLKLKCFLTLYLRRIYVLRRMVSKKPSVFKNLYCLK